MKLFKNQKGTSDIVIVATILGIIGAIFITGVFVWQEINGTKEIDRVLSENTSLKEKVVDLKIKAGENVEGLVADKDLYYCELDSDCVANTDCNPTAYINKKYRAKEYRIIRCNVLCKGPIDCKNVTAACANNKCIIKELQK